MDGDGVRFRVWAPERHEVTLVVEGPGRAEITCARQRDGFFETHVPDLPAGARYWYRLDDRGPFPDPASRFQPDGVHGPSAVVDPSAFQWAHAGWKGRRADDLVIYELHVGTFSPAGTFAGAQEFLPTIADLGVTAIELMPIGDFPGSRGWGYDGVALFAPARCYGTPDDLRRLIDIAHGLGLAVLLDVVYNHFGPDGAYAGAFSPYYFTAGRATPWGDAVNVDGDHSLPVREFFIENALHWVHEYRIDGLRLDATHALDDASPRHLLSELTERVKTSAADRAVVVIGEDNRNLAELARPRDRGGLGLDAVWADDFHHQVRRYTTGDAEGYFQDFSGSVTDLATTITQGWFFRGEYSAHAGRPRGTPCEDLDYDRFVVCLQNHDQVGNRAHGERLHHQIDAASWRALSTLLLTVPETPLLFMGQEWAATTPFLFFADHHDALGRLVTAGRRREFEAFAAFRDPDTRERIPDPQALQTFFACRLLWEERGREPHASCWRCYRTLLHLRRREPALRHSRRGGASAAAVGDHIVLVRRSAPGHPTLLTAVCLRGGETLALRPQPLAAAPTGARWEVLFTSEDPQSVAAPHPASFDHPQAVTQIEFTRPTGVILKCLISPRP
jgi:maltooligosyltrehalose trehalohydrolase